MSLINALKKLAKSQNALLIQSIMLIKLLYDLKKVLKFSISTIASQIRLKVLFKLLT